MPGHPQIAIFVNEATLIPVLVAVAPAETIAVRFVEQAVVVLETLGTPASIIADETAAMIECNRWPSSTPRQVDQPEGRSTATRPPSCCAKRCVLRPLAAAGAPLILRDVPARVAIDGALHTWPSYSRTLQRVVIEHRIDDDLAAVATPLRILVGAHDHVSTPASSGAAIERTDRDAVVLTVVNDEDHHLALHRPDLVAYAVDQTAGHVANSQ